MRTGRGYIEGTSARYMPASNLPKTQGTDGTVQGTRRFLPPKLQKKVTDGAGEEETGDKRERGQTPKTPIRSLFLSQVVSFSSDALVST